ARERPDRAGERRVRCPGGRDRPTDADELIAACDAIARSLRGGESLTTAIERAADRHPAGPVVEIAARVRGGQRLPAAVDRVVAGSSDPDGLLAVQVLAVAAEHGGPQAEAIDRAASTLRERQALRAERLAQGASARISTRVMTVLPFGFMGFVAST